MGNGQLTKIAVPGTVRFFVEPNAMVLSRASED
jgi:hypothetical protein